MAQGQQSGTLGGRLSSSDNLGLPGATVTVVSESLQGERTTVADINGVYSFPGLPPGSYTVKFEMDGMSSVQRTARVPLGGAVTMDQVLSIAPVAEMVVVNGARPAPVSSPAGAFNVRAEQFSLLPVAARRWSRRPGAGTDRQHAEQQPGDHRRGLRLRQRVPDGRRRRQRQRVRPAERPVHRGRHPGGAGADLRYLGRVRPVLAAASST